MTDRPDYAALVRAIGTDAFIVCARCGVADEHHSTTAEAADHAYDPHVVLAAGGALNDAVLAAWRASMEAEPDGEVWEYGPDEEVDSCPTCGSSGVTQTRIGVDGNQWRCDAGHRWIAVDVPGPSGGSVDVTGEHGPR